MALDFCHQVTMELHKIVVSFPDLMWPCRALALYCVKGDCLLGAPGCCSGGVQAGQVCITSFLSSDNPYRLKSHGSRPSQVGPQALDIVHKSSRWKAAATRRGEATLKHLCNQPYETGVNNPNMHFVGSSSTSAPSTSIPVIVCEIRRKLT